MRKFMPPLGHEDLPYTKQFWFGGSSTVPFNPPLFYYFKYSNLTASSFEPDHTSLGLVRNSGPILTGPFHPVGVTRKPSRESRDSMIHVHNCSESTFLKSRPSLTNFVCLSGYEKLSWSNVQIRLLGGQFWTG